MKKRLFLLISILACMLVACVCLVGCNNDEPDVPDKTDEPDNHVHQIIRSEIATQPTCTTDGVRIAFCDCGEHFIEAISALGHNYSDEWEIDIEPTQTTTGERSKHCSQCESKIEITEIPVLPYSDGLKYEQNTNGSYSVVGVEDASLIQSDILNIAPTYKGAEVTSIVNVGLLSVEEIIVPDTVTSISFGAFENCYNVRRMKLPFLGETKNATENNYFGYIFGAQSYYYNVSKIPATLKTLEIAGGTIGNYALSYCDYITSFIIGEGVTSIGNYAFYSCDGLTELEIPDSVTHLGEHIFEECGSFSSVTIGDGITNIGNYAFSNCDALKSVDMGRNVETIGDYAFYSCGVLSTIPLHVTSIGDYAFANCYRLSLLSLYNVTSIGDSAFRGCTGISSVRLPDSLTSIGNNAFYGCTKVTRIIMGKNVTSIGDFAFSNCTSLTSIEIPDSVTSIGKDAFDNCDSLTRVYYIGTEQEWSQISIDEDNEPLGSDMVYYYSETEPDTDGNYWHYDAGGTTPIVWGSQEE